MEDRTLSVLPVGSVRMAVAKKWCGLCMLRVTAWGREPLCVTWSGSRGYSIIYNACLRSTADHRAAQLIKQLIALDHWVAFI